MKVFIVTQKELEHLLTLIDRNPAHGANGGSSTGTMSQHDQMIYANAHKFYNYQVRKWVSQISEDSK